MDFNQEIGKQSFVLKSEPYILESASVVGNKEGDGPLGSLFDVIFREEEMGEDSWEKAESAFQKVAVETLLEKSGIEKEEVRFLFSGDLLGQEIASSFGVGTFQIPTIGVYGACSTAGLSLAMASMTIDGGFAKKVIAVTSSHFASAERQFRFPLDYANQRPLSSTWTVTGSGAFLLGEKQEKALGKVTGVTFGKVVDYGVKDSMNMGACMAPAAADTIYNHLQDFGRTPQDYDRIITGDLGYVGQELLFKLLEEKGIDISKVHMDCGIEIFNKETQDTHSGGSGCGCSAVTLSGYVLPKLKSGEWKRILFAPTGALLSKVSFNEGQSVPGICHGVVIEKL